MIHSYLSVCSFDKMADAARPSEDNLRTYILTELRCILRDLEDRTDDKDKIVRDYALYRLEKVILLCVQCQETLPNVIDQLTVDMLLEAHYELAKTVEKEHTLLQAQNNANWIEGIPSLIDIEKLAAADALLEAPGELARTVEKEDTLPQAQIDVKEIEGIPSLIDVEKLTADACLEVHYELARRFDKEHTLLHAQKDANQLVRRPKKDIPEEPLKLCLKAGFSKTKIAKMFGVCNRTISNRIQEFGLEGEVMQYSEKYTELDSIIHDLVHCSSDTRSHHIYI